MNYRLIITILSFCLSYSGLMAQTNGKIPHLQKKGNTAQLMVNNKPFLILGGELHNSSSSNADYMRPIWEQLKKKNLNTVVAPVYWEMIEPTEGNFDFALVDSMIVGLRKQNLKLVILWFATWKNGYSTYVPSWVKRNPDKYPYAKDKNGKTLQTLSAFGEETMKADARAFKALMKHIKEFDQKEQTVIMAQIENEVGIFYSSRDYIGDKLYQSQVPADVITYLKNNKLQPELEKVWKANGSKTKGNWEAVFGKNDTTTANWKNLSYLTDELFTVYHYARYMGAVAEAGKSEYPIPMFVNAWIKQPKLAFPGKYPTGGPIPHTLDFWRLAAPAVDMIVPDIYISGANEVIETYRRDGNAVFVPEIGHHNTATFEGMYAFGSQEIIGFSPFGIDDMSPEEDPFTPTYKALSRVKDVILKYQSTDKMTGILLDKNKPTQSFDLGDYAIRANIGKTIIDFNLVFAGFPSKDPKPEVAGGILINIGPDEFIIVGKHFNIELKAKAPNPSLPFLDIELMEEGYFDNDVWKATRRLNGDESFTSMGGDAGFGFKKDPSIAAVAFPNTEEFKVMRFKVFRYK
ncbi:mannonate dehydratase [Runella aurantiaca]|uniref:Mannonate dehydratase n=2 Tax=Runella aurantiaca TaxID=2282308 RepID=A0A369I3X4_9BACT|nr:mannonate dehydratase [Runella aurantiaca]